MLDKNKIEEGLALIIKDIVKCQTHLAGYDYTGIQLQHPRIVVDVKMPQFVARQSNVDSVKKISETHGLRSIRQQFSLDVVITSLGSPQDNLAYEKLQELRGKLHADYDLLFAEHSLKELVVNSFGEIEDIAVELGTKIENRYQMIMTLNGSTEVYSGTIEKILEVNPQVSYIK